MIRDFKPSSGFGDAVADAFPKTLPLQVKSFDKEASETANIHKRPDEWRLVFSTPSGHSKAYTVAEFNKIFELAQIDPEKMRKTYGVEPSSLVFATEYLAALRQAYAFQFSVARTDNFNETRTNRDWRFVFAKDGKTIELSASDILDSFAEPAKAAVLREKGIEKDQLMLASKNFLANYVATFNKDASAKLINIKHSSGTWQFIFNYPSGQIVAASAVDIDNCSKPNDKTTRIKLLNQGITPEAVAVATPFLQRKLVQRNAYKLAKRATATEPAPEPG